MSVNPNYKDNVAKVVDSYSQSLSAEVLPGINYCGIARSCIESMMKALMIKLYNIDDFSKENYKVLSTAKPHTFYPNSRFSLSTYIALLKRKGIFSDDILASIDKIRNVGNKALHDGQHGVIKVELQTVFEWFIDKYGDGHEKVAIELNFNNVADRFADHIVARMPKNMSTLDTKPVSESNTLKTAPQKFTQPNSVEFINHLFWEGFKISDKRKMENELKFFHTNPAYSVGNKIQQVIANNFYVKPNSVLKINEIQPQEQDHDDLDKLFSNLEQLSNYSCLIKVTGKGGSGKTTFLWHLAFQYHNIFQTYHLKNFDLNAIKFIKEQNLKDDKILIFLDSIYEKHSDKASLNNFFEELLGFEKIIFILSERDNWLYYFEETFKIDKYFDHVYNINFENSLNPEMLFLEFYRLTKFATSLVLDPENERSFKAEFIQNYLSTKSVVKAKHLFLIHLQDSNKIKFEFDWDDWNTFVNNNKSEYGSLKYLYHFIALFQQFGQKIPIGLNFNAIFNKQDIELDKISEALRAVGCPISITEESRNEQIEDYLSIGHDLMGELLINHYLNSTDKIILKTCLDNFFKNIHDSNSIYLFRNIHRNSDFKKADFFKDFLDPKKGLSIKILEKYLESIPFSDYSKNERKCLTELIQTYKGLGDKTKMLENINKLIDAEENDNDGNFFGKHMLVNYYIDYDPENYGKAAEILNELERKFGLDLYIESGFKKLYGKGFKEIPEKYQNKDRQTEETEDVRILMVKAVKLLDDNNITDALNIYRSIITDCPKDYHARTKLAHTLRTKVINSRTSKLERVRVLEESKKYLFEAISQNKRSNHAYTELGETFYALGDIEKAITILKDGINNCADNIACNTTLAKIYRNCALSKNYEIAQIVEYLSLSFEILSQCVESNKDKVFKHVQSSVGFAETCMVMFEVNKDNSILIHDIKNEQLLKYIESSLFPFIYDNKNEISPERTNLNTLKLVLSFYKNQKLADKFKRLSIELFNVRADFDFWFNILEIYVQEEDYNEIIFDKIFNSEIDTPDLFKLLNKIVNKNFIAFDCSLILRKVIISIKQDQIAFKKGCLFLALYNYVYGRLDVCKNSLSLFSNSANTPSNSPEIWADFFQLITDNRMYINLELLDASYLNDQSYYFNEANQIKSDLANKSGKGSAENQITYYKYLINQTERLSRLKALDAQFKENFGQDNFYIQMLLGEIYLRKSSEAVSGLDPEKRMKIAKRYLETAFELAKNAAYSYLKPSYIGKKPKSSESIKDFALHRFYKERVFRDLIDCYLQLGSDILLNRSQELLEANKRWVNIPLLYVLDAKIYIKKEDLHNAYESAKIGLINCEKNYLHNPEIYNESLTALKGELIAEMTLAEHRNWELKRKFFKSRSLNHLKKSYESAFKNNPKLKWVMRKIDEIDGKSL